MGGVGVGVGVGVGDGGGVVVLYGVAAAERWQGMFQPCYPHFMNSERVVSLVWRVGAGVCRMVFHNL